MVRNRWTEFDAAMLLATPGPDIQIRTRRLAVSWSIICWRRTRIRRVSSSSPTGRAFRGRGPFGSNADVKRRG